MYRPGRLETLFKNERNHRDWQGRAALFAPAWRIASPRKDIVCALVAVLAQCLQRLGRQLYKRSLLLRIMSYCSFALPVQLT
ncbi:hypothetical protein DCAR_0208471 [Daucus carota subsp. sativus]|uniref:Uncharacterized protein n=1 Tax=Daucus carota subsp. sativus TaxID=79200 RepID=A0A166EK47_DAUCS|nr:hypothetical protein DCAR_0208471 [Daucus carota subsp. sativus]